MPVRCLIDIGAGVEWLGVAPKARGKWQAVRNKIHQCPNSQDTDEYLNATSSRLNQCYVRISPSVALQQPPRRLAQKRT